MTGLRLNSDKVSGNFTRKSRRGIGTPDIEELAAEAVEAVEDRDFTPAFVVLSNAAYECLKLNRDLGVDEDTIDELLDLPIVIDFERPNDEVSAMAVPKASGCFR